MKDFINTVLGFIAENAKIINIGVGIIVFLLLFLLRNKLAKALLSVVGSIAFRKNERNKNSFISTLLRPLSVFFVILGIFLTVYINVHSVVVVRCFKIATIFVISWAIVSYLSDNLQLLFKLSDSTDDKLNATVIKFITNILKIVIIAIAVVMVISELGYNINGLLTGIGVGGLAVSLAAQDAISNLISGFVIVLDKPFLVGDFIETDSLQGTVVDITMRSTKIRTLEDSIVTVPNKKIADGEVFNISSMDKRLIDTNLSLLYSTSSKTLQDCQNAIMEFLKNEEKIVDYPIRVNFSKLEDSALIINIYCYTTITEINEYFEYVSTLNHNFKEIVENNGGEFAYPSTSVYIEKK
ncbi:MAG: mechanosensitive ion channel family protein [Eubacterium sp.]|nr:mechanosensitive ion channel family protein [Eubacterium sp.]MBQ8981035.1 mechanosensitive ion channel family protein [Eubacterium sp.]MBR1530516.1 mechanosensitive ion channel family protein [Eubacterium sp.]MBR2279266.1 mechanosensitive ion channel family protein [Eubacterium sp.]